MQTTANHDDTTAFIQATQGLIDPKWVDWGLVNSGFQEAMPFPAALSWGLMRFDAHLGCLSSIPAALGFMGGTGKGNEPSPGLVITG